MRITSTPARRALLGGLAAALALGLTSCSADSETYGVEDRSISVSGGGEFSLELPERGNLGEWWFIDDPRPDGSVLKYEGEQREAGDGQSVSFDFTAGKPGRTTVTLLHCAYGSCKSAEQAHKDPKRPITKAPADHTDLDSDNNGPVSYTWTVTVR